MKKTLADGLPRLDLPLSEQRQEAFAVYVLVGHQRKSRHFKKGGIEVGACDGYAAGGMRAHYTGPLDDEWFAYAALVHPALALGKRRVAGGGAFCRGKTAVIRGEDDDGVVCLTGLFQRVQ